MPEYKVFLNMAALNEFNSELNALKRGEFVSWDPKKPRPNTCALVLLAIREQYREGDF
jgi:hypothetical protein